MKKVILTIAVILSGLSFVSCEKNELTATEVIKCQQAYEKRENELNGLLKYGMVSYEQYTTMLSKAKQDYDNCIIESEGN